MNDLHNYPNQNQQPPQQVRQAAPQPQTWQPAQPAQPSQVSQVSQQWPTSAPAAQPTPTWQPPLQETKKKKAGPAAIIAICAVIAILINLGGILIYDAVVNGKRTVYTDPIIVSNLGDNPWSKVVEDIYACSVSFRVDGGVEGSWTGSGVVISPEGYILTNDHVAGDSAIRRMECTLKDGSSYRGELVAKDVANDLALVKIDPDVKLHYVRIGNSDMLKVGDQVVTLGNPLSEHPDTVAEGIVANTERKFQIGGRSSEQELIQVTAPVSSGNSGGALLNCRGELVAIVNARMMSAFRNGSIIDAENIGFCVPIKFAIELIRSSGADIKLPDTPTLDIKAVAIGKAEAKKSAWYPVEGVYIDKVTEYGAGWYAGLQKNDRLVSIGGKDVTEPGDVTKLISKAAIDEEIIVIIERNAMYYQYSIKTMRDYS